MARGGMGKVSHAQSAVIVLAGTACSNLRCGLLVRSSTRTRSVCRRWTDSAYPSSTGPDDMLPRKVPQGARAPNAEAATDRPGPRDLRR